MKIQHLSFSFIVSFFILACSDSNKEDVTPPAPETPSITIPSTENITPTIEQRGGTVTVAFSTSDTWTASIANNRADSWISVSPVSGNKGDAKISITAKANEMPDERNATITLKCGTISKAIVITQKQQDALLVNSAKYEVGAEGTTIDMEVKANIKFDVEIKCDWIRELIGGRSLDVYKKHFQVLPNESGSKREGEIVFKSGDLSETIKVYQDYNDFITLTQKEFPLSDEGGVVDVEIRSTVEYGVKMLSGSDWVTEQKNRAVSTHTLHYQVAPNESYDAREAKIVFFDKKNENIADTVSIYQAFKGAILIAKDKYEFEATGGDLELKLQTNLELDVIFSADWIQQVAGRALTEYNLHFNILPHEGKEPREGTITVKAKDRALTQTVKIKQLEVKDYNAAERETLIALYKATNGDNWKDKANWCSDKPLSEWYGVQIDQSGRVSYINLPWNQLGGSIPDSFFTLSQLTWINFEGNNLVGTLSEKWGDFANAYFLGLSDNQFTGSIPASFAQLLNLTYFSLRQNQLTGSIPTEMEQMSNWETVISGQLEPQLPGYGFTDEATTQMIDLGENLYLHPEGFAIELRNGKNAILTVEELQQKMKYLYTKFNDDFDFLCYIHNVQNPADLGNDTNAGEFMTINTDGITGLGNNPQNDSGKFGSDGKLKGMIAIFSRMAMGVFMHEFAHYYGAIDLGQSNIMYNGVTEISPVHWGISSVNGQLGGFDINTLQRNVDGNPKKYKAEGSANAGQFNPAAISNNLYSPLELYIMGLIPKEDVPDTYVYDGVSATAEDAPWMNGVFYAEKERVVTIEDIVAKYGERHPDSKNSQKSFRVLTVIFTANPINDREWRILKQRLLLLETKGSSGLAGFPSFGEATGGRATLQISDLTGAMRK